MEFPTELTTRYHVSSHIARGGMADVYEGLDTELNRKIAIKVLHTQFSSDEAFVKRFRREAQAAANLSHPNIVGIYDWGQARNTYFIVMEIVEGRSLREVLKSEGALLSRRAVEIIAETAAALSVAHTAGLVHRDVKPGNILLAKDGTVKVTDFGIARAWDDSQELTKTGAVMGTATYFSPEQAQGAAADARSDVYSLGVVLYEALTGRPPFMGDSPMSVAFQHVSTEAPPPSSLNPDVPKALDAIVAKAMKKDPSARYQTAEEMRQDLLAVLQGAPVEQVGAAVGGDSSATRVLPSVPPATVPPDEIYRQLEEEPPSQLPFIITAFALLVALGILLFFLFRLAGNGSTDPDQLVVPNVAGRTSDDAVQILHDQGFEVVTAFEISPTIESGIVIRTEPAAGTSVATGSTVEIVISSGSQGFPAPSVVGQTLEDARRILENAGLEVGLVDQRPDATFPEGVVVEQNPAAGVEVGLGTPVTLVVSTGPELIVLPDLSGLTERDAIRQLTGLGLDYVVDDDYSPGGADEVAEGLVIRTDPLPGTEVLSGDVVTIVVSLGLEPVTVPDLLGKTPQQAKAILDGLGLKLNVSATTVPVVDIAQDGVIVAQIPPEGLQALPGDIVTVTLGEFQTPPTTTTTTVAPTTSTGGGGPPGSQP